MLWIFIFCLNIGKNISINLSSKQSQKLIDYAKQSGTDALKTASKRAIQKTTEATSDLIGDKTNYKITGTIQSKSIAPMQTEYTTENSLEVPQKYTYQRQKNYL